MKEPVLFFLLLASLTFSLSSPTSAQVDLGMVDVSYRHTTSTIDSWNITLKLYDPATVKPIRIELASINQELDAQGTYSFYNRASLCSIDVAPKTADGVLNESSMELDPKGIESWTNSSLPLRTTQGNGSSFECWPTTWKTSATENVVLTQNLNLSVGNPYEVSGFGALMGTTMNDLNVPTMKGRTQTAVNSIRNLRAVAAVDPSTPWSPIMVASRLASLDFTIGKSGTTIPAEGKFSDAEFKGTVNGLDQTIAGTRRIDNITEYWYEHINDSNLGFSVTGDIYNSISLNSDVIHELDSGLIMTSSVVSTLRTSTSLTFVEGDPLKPLSTITLDLEHDRRTVVEDVIERTSDGLGAVPTDSGSYLEEDDVVVYSETWSQDTNGLESSIITSAPVGLDSWVTDNRSISLTSSASGKGYRTYTAASDPFGQSPFSTKDEFTTYGSAIISISENGKSQYLNSTSYTPGYAGGDPWYGTGVVGGYSAYDSILAPASDFGSIRGYTYAAPWANTSTTSSIYTKAIPQAKGGASSTTAINETSVYSLEGKNGENSLSITIEVFRTRDAITGTVLTESVTKTISEYRVFGPGDAHFGSLLIKSTVTWDRVLESNDALSLFLADESTTDTTTDTTSTDMTTTTIISDEPTTSQGETKPADTISDETSVTNPLPVPIVPWIVGFFMTAAIVRRRS